MSTAGPIAAPAAAEPSRERLGRRVRGEPSRRAKRSIGIVNSGLNRGSVLNGGSHMPNERSQPPSGESISRLAWIGCGTNGL